MKKKAPIFIGVCAHHKDIMNFNRNGIFIEFTTILCFGFDISTLSENEVDKSYVIYSTCLLC